MYLTDEDVTEILRILETSPYDELRLETDRFTLILERSDAPEGGWTQEVHTKAEPAVTEETATAEQPAEGEAAAAEASAGPAAQEGVVDVRSPLPGTFYRAPKPGAPPFVEVGSKVDEHTVVAIIETMKLMNSAYAGTTGEVAEICAENGAFVDSGAVIMRVKEAAS